MDNYHACVLDIQFYLINTETGEILENKDGTERAFEFKKGVRFKPLEYLCENLDIKQLKEIKNG
jgi:hypothetical protein|tara:strand:+ start:1583 stop:1774 length:192 start_codon:yes stop_codon:yes gene_type:complete